MFISYFLHGENAVSPSWGSCHFFEIVIWENVHLGSCCLGNCTFGKLPLGKLSLEKLPSWENAFGKVPNTIYSTYPI